MKHNNFIPYNNYTDDIDIYSFFLIILLSLLNMMFLYFFIWIRIENIVSLYKKDCNVSKLKPKKINSLNNNYYDAILTNMLL